MSLSERFCGNEIVLEWLGQRDKAPAVVVSMPRASEMIAAKARLRLRQNSSVEELKLLYD